MTQGSPLKILILFSIVTAVLSAFLDNVTTVLIIIPIIIELTAGMGLDPKMYVISQAIISNIGGTATLIGDPPNIIIGSKVGLTFNQFMVNLTLPVMVCLAAALAYLWATNRDKFKPIDTNLAKLFSVQLLLEKIRYNFLDTKIDKIFLTKGLVCLGLAIVLFVTQTITKLSPGVVAMLVAMIPIVKLMLESNPIPNNILWWALSLGACLGGNLTMIGASANIVSVGMAKKLGQEISFLDFARKSVVITLVIASGYLMFYLWISL